MQSFRLKGTSVRLNVPAKALKRSGRNAGSDPANPDSPEMAPKLLFRQLFEKDSCTYTYLLADVGHHEKPALLIDPVEKMVDRDANLIKELGLKLVFVMNTHVHADHITGTGTLKAKFPGVQSVISEASKAKADILVCPNDKIYVGNLFLELRATPGHTQGCVTYVTGESPNQPHPRMAFTGDALLIRGCGRTDFQGGNARQLYKSIHSQVTTVEEELLYNTRLTKDEDAFIDIMKSRRTVA